MNREVNLYNLYAHPVPGILLYADPNLYGIFKNCYENFKIAWQCVPDVIRQKISLTFFNGVAGAGFFSSIQSRFFQTAPDFRHIPVICMNKVKKNGNFNKID